MKKSRTSKNTLLLFRLIVITTVMGVSTLVLIRFVNNIFGKPGVNNLPVRDAQVFGVRMPEGFTIHGIDVSRHQGPIDWKAVGNARQKGFRISFVFIKATEGISHQDANFNVNWTCAGQQELIRGAYLYYYPSRDAKQQAQNFIRLARLTKGDLPPVVDIEHSNGRKSKKICEGLKSCLENLEKQYEVKPIIYTNVNFYKTHLKGHFDEYPLWISCYYKHERFKTEFEESWKFWQHSEKGRVDGIDENVDLNVFSGTVEQLLNMRIKQD